ncbi:ACP S-malonyltransferase [Rubrobacter indicoceani]|uniref:ACP S-malonyltransferase n=1 Tax=Rubrobacter indicoceani TaxID=2051957 RepID=UPI000E5BD713|nr:ACP S-malonyltransferase [Rubrobacter indicoceani]
MAAGEVLEGGGLKAFVFPGQGGGVPGAPEETIAAIRRVIGDVVPDQVKFFARAARDADEVLSLDVYPDVVAGHSLGEYGAAYSAGCFDFEAGVWLVAHRDRFLAEVAEQVPGGMVAILRANPDEVAAALGDSSDSVVSNYNSPKQTVVSGLRETLGEAVAKIKGRKVPLNVAFAAHSPYVASAAEKMKGVLDQVEFKTPDFPVVSAIDGSLLITSEAVREALKNQMVAPVRWIKVVDTLARLRVEEWIELGGGGVLTRMLRDFEVPSLRGVTFEDFRTRLSEQAQSFLNRGDENRI